MNNFPEELLMEDMDDFQNHRMIKRRLMEAQGCGEVRRLHIVYFLSRKGRIEHPHLIRVHHLSRNGVRLKDVKRWLGELRGKDMPKSFAWSYKRKYKTGYLWQDLLDDDLITPISDNEYVLKGSEISSINREFSYTEKKSPIQKEEKQSLLQSSTQENEKTVSSKEEIYSHSSDSSFYVSTKSSSEIEEQSQIFGSETSTLTDESGKNETTNHPNTSQNGNQTENSSHNEKKENRSSYFYSTLLNKKNKRKGNRVKIDENLNTSCSPAEAVDSSPKVNTPSPMETLSSKSKSHNSNSLLHNLITCGGVDTNDSAVVTINNKNNNKSFLKICSSDPRNVPSAEICKRDRIGGSQRVLGTPNWTHKERIPCRKSFDGVKEKNGYRDQRVSTSAAYKPVNGPNCSQCGKPFKPEKMHSHMKSCKGMKSLSKNTSAAAAAPSSAVVAPTVSPIDYSSGHLLSH